MVILGPMAREHLEDIEDSLRNHQGINWDAFQTWLELIDVIWMNQECIAQLDNESLISNTARLLDGVDFDKWKELVLCVDAENRLDPPEHARPATAKEVANALATSS